MRYIAFNEILKPIKTTIIPNLKWNQAKSEE